MKHHISYVRVIMINHAIKRIVIINHVITVNHVNHRNYDVVMVDVHVINYKATSGAIKLLRQRPKKLNLERAQLNVELLVAEMKIEHTASETVVN